ncbi:GerMN domain-containing protein [Mumia sp. ZJ1417]|uniref:LpqB family beta-propeller domain-containing protein n=1 Tax=Mumia sp. ZJ1417 TaxID=2708082 RepID=UPI0014201042|nr:LpqB family beta-propeller domain-containing protein [Mumia sp. ZJ1417]QMW65573.1 GerMN domain-containing protein [Mumia sp. ZJ1417]
MTRPISTSRTAIRPFVRLGAALSLGALLAGCVSIPDGGPVRVVEDGRPQQVSPARIRPAGPADGASPRDIVNGFLQAMMSSPVRYDIARRFLTDGAGDDWRPEESVTVYSLSSVAEPEERSGAESVAVDIAREAVLTEQGRFTVPAAREQHFDLTLVQEDEQWRIADPPPGALITDAFFEDYYDAVNAYYFDSAGEQLVAAPVHLPDDEGRPTDLVSSLLGGPDGVLGGQARSFLPSTWKLAAPVEVDDQGVALVRFAGSDSGVSVGDRERLSAQLVWSLRQISTVTGVEIRIGDRPIALPNTPEVQRIDAWDQFDPAADRPTQLFAMREGRLLVVGRSSTGPFAGAWGRDPVPADDFRVAVDAERIALVTGGRRVVSVSPLAGEPALVPARQGTDLLRPSWDAAGRLWTIDRVRGGSRLTVGPADEPPRSIDLGPLAGGRVTGFELSPDGARFTATARVGARDALYVGAIRYDAEGGGVVGLVDIAEIPLPTETGVPLSAAWRSSTTIALLARAQERVPQVAIVAVDGSSSVTGAVRVGLLPQDGARQVLSAGLLSSPIFVLDAEGMLWTQNGDGRWAEASDEPVSLAAFAG